jgi:hypothetical protein
LMLSHGSGGGGRVESKQVMALGTS